MGKVKESSVEDLERQRSQLQAARGEIEGRIRGLKEAIDLAEARDTELARAGFAGRDIGRERARLREQTAAKQAELDRETRDLGLLVEEFQRVEREHREAAAAADKARTVTLAAEIETATAALAAELRQAVAGPMARLREIEATHQDLLALWQTVYRTEFLGGHPLRQLGHALRALEVALEATGGRS